MCEIDGEFHEFFKHKTTEGIYIVDLRPYWEKKRKYGGLHIVFSVLLDEFYQGDFSY